MTAVLIALGWLYLAGLVIGVLLVIWTEIRSAYFRRHDPTPRCQICNWPCSTSEVICARCVWKNEEQTI